MKTIFIFITLWFSLFTFSQKKQITIGLEEGFKPYEFFISKNNNLWVYTANYNQNLSPTNRKKHLKKFYLYDGLNFDKIFEMKGSYKLNFRRFSHDDQAFEFKDNRGAGLKTYLWKKGEEKEIERVDTGHKLNAKLYQFELDEGHSTVRTGPNLSNKTIYKFWNSQGEKKIDKEIETPNNISKVPYLFNSTGNTFTLFTERAHSNSREQIVKREIMLLKYNEDGSLIGQKDFVIDSKSGFFYRKYKVDKFIFDSTKENYYAYGIQLNEKDEALIYITKFDSEGELLWKQHYDYNSKKDPRINSLFIKMVAGEVGDKFTLGIHNANDRMLSCYLLDKNNGDRISEKFNFYKIAIQRGDKKNNIGRLVYTLQNKEEKYGLDITSTMLNLLDGNTYSKDFFNTERYRIKTLINKGKVVSIRFDLEVNKSDISMFSEIK